jgi:UDP-3-O-[3-hydroxymyristoyl] glucosamine N-acyltransferase
MAPCSRRLGELAASAGVELQGDPDREIRGVATLDCAEAGDIAFLANRRYRGELSTSRAGAVILQAADRAHWHGDALVTKNPYLAYARVADLLHPWEAPPPGTHPSAVVSQSARIDAAAVIGPLCVVEDGVEIGPGVHLGPGCIVGEGTRIGADTRLVARVTVLHQCVIGARCILHPGAIIGSDGFGNANDGGRWVKVPQLGRVVIGDDVEIGANTTVDRGSLRDTVISDGVRLDNLIQVGHNVIIGEHTAAAAFVGISGSTTIGRRCMLGGAAGLAGHLSIADDVFVTGMAMVTHSLREPGAYSSGIPATPNREWRRNVARFQHLDDLARRVRALEAALGGVAAGADSSDINDA